MLKVRIPDKLRELVAKFEINREHYKSPDFLETQVRVEFINPLLRLLGWDVDNESGFAPEYKDVIHELHAGNKQHIDYVFKVGQSRKFLIEAKRPSAKIESDRSYAFQAKSYAYAMEIPLVLVTDFEELAIYQGYRDKTAPPPIETDDPLHRRVFFCYYHEYPKYWDFLYSLLSKKAIMLGLHDHLLQRLDAVSASIGKSIYTLEGFNLLYSIVQSFGGEDYSVEQDLAVNGKHNPPVAEFQEGISTDHSRILRPLQPTTGVVSPAQSFYLLPVFS